jgi:hypothetical protein
MFHLAGWSLPHSLLHLSSALQSSFLTDSVGSVYGWSIIGVAKQLSKCLGKSSRAEMLQGSGQHRTITIRNWKPMSPGGS